MKMLYLTTWDFIHENTDGVCKKIKSQVVVFKGAGCEVDIVYIKGNRIIYEENGNSRVVGRVGNMKKVSAYIKLYSVLKGKKYDCVYNRYGMMDSFYYRVLAKLHENGARIVIEMPTYPYDGERPAGILYWAMFQWDRIYRGKLKDIVDRIVTYSRDDKIYTVPTIRIRNGIDLELVHPVSGKRLDDTIVVIV